MNRLFSIQANQQKGHPHMNTVRRLLQNRASIWSASPNMSAYDALHMMIDADVGALMVVENDALVGIITERDYARRLALQERSLHDIRIGEVMSQNVIAVNADQSLEECMALMTERHIRHLPVLDGKRPIGMVSIRDVVAHIISEQDFVIEQLQNYLLDQRTAGA